MSSYDAIIIGAGMSGLAAAARLGLYDQKVLLLEKHAIAGGLNSYYQRKINQELGLYPFDVGLHALTNFVKKGEKNKPLTKLLKQLRLSYDDLKLHEQTYSLIAFPEVQLKFSNNFELMLSEVKKYFPYEMNDFLKLVSFIQSYNELDLTRPYQSTKTELAQFIKNPLLREMILCPLLIYGSAWADDMDFSQFVIMFKSLYLEGFARPEGGVRTIIDLLLKTLKERNVEIKFKTEVESILTNENVAVGVKTKKGEEFYAKKILSSMGLPETAKKTSPVLSGYEIGPMTFVESIFVFDKKIPLSSQEATIIFSNDKSTYSYRPSTELFDPSSAVICFPDHYETNNSGPGMARVTYISQYQGWKNLERERYLHFKKEASQLALSLVQKWTPHFDGRVIFEDTFTPLTIERYTSHLDGTVYGSTTKSRDGRTPLNNLFVIGTDQGFLGIVGSMLSGISMANLHVLMGDS